VRWPHKWGFKSGPAALSGHISKAPGFAGGYLHGIGLRFEAMEHGGEYPDTMPQAIKPIDAEGRSCVYLPITQDGKVVDSQGYVLDPEDDDR